LCRPEGYLAITTTLNILETQIGVPQPLLNYGPINNSELSEDWYPIRLTMHSKDNVVTVFNSAPRHEDEWQNGIIAP
jgi:hypothetical protein